MAVVQNMALRLAWSTGLLREEKLNYDPAFNPPDQGVSFWPPLGPGVVEGTAYHRSESSI